jgi:hypothetical protein
VNGWTDGEDKYMAIWRGEMPYDRPDEPEEVEAEIPTREQTTLMPVPVTVVSCADCGRELYRYQRREPLPPMGAVLHTCAAQGRANRAARRGAA